MPFSEARWFRSRWLRAGLAAVAAGLAWWVLDSTRSRASWLELRVSQPLVAGQSARFVVSLAPGIREGSLVLDLHWRTRKREYRRTLAAGRAYTIDGSVPEYVFDFVLPSNPDLGAVNAVVYVGPSPHWLQRTRSALSDPLEVKAADSSVRSGNGDWVLKRIPVFLPDRSELPPLESSRTWRATVAGLLLLAAGGLAWKQRRIAGAIARDPPSGPGNARVRLPGLVAVLVLLATGELINAGAWLTDRSREIAKMNDLYLFRQELQQPLTLLAAAIGCGAMAYVCQIRQPAPIRWVWIGVLGHVLLTLAGAFSLHEFDALMVNTLGGFTVFEWSKLVTALLTVFAVAWCWRARAFQAGGVS
ncbi:MAG: hypothetical protein JNK85_24565 [Verrucomicrobiales bacterium]|nr:hypothetical protein [Verrucomicrobiales bacterium]